jgi:hypothetical protein
MWITRKQMKALMDEVSTARNCYEASVARFANQEKDIEKLKKDAARLSDEVRYLKDKLNKKKTIKPSQEQPKPINTQVKKTAKKSFVKEENK